MNSGGRAGLAGWWWRTFVARSCKFGTRTFLSFSLSRREKLLRRDKRTSSGQSAPSRCCCRPAVFVAVGVIVFLRRLISKGGFRPPGWIISHLLTTCLQSSSKHKRGVGVFIFRRKRERERERERGGRQRKEKSRRRRCLRLAIVREAAGAVNANVRGRMPHGQHLLLPR